MSDTLKKAFFWNTVGVFMQNAISPLLLIVITRINGIDASGLFSFAASISIVLFAFVMFQSCAAGISNSLAENGESGGSAGLIVAIILLAGGIVSIATRNGSKGGNIALIVLFALGALCGFTMAGSYADLNVWAAWCLICAVFAAVSLKKGQ